MSTENKIFNTLIAVLCTSIVALLTYSVIKYYSIDRGMTAETPDIFGPFSQSELKEAMYERSENWHQISEMTVSRQKFTGIDGPSMAAPLTAELVRQFCGEKDDSKVNKCFRFSNTSLAFNNLIRNNYNNIFDSDYSETNTELPVKLIFSCEPAENYRQGAENENVTLSSRAVALEGIVFITHKDNPVDSLTVKQIQDIYSGKIKNWKEVGGNDVRIRAFQRDDQTDLQKAMEEKVMCGEEMGYCPVVVEKFGRGMKEVVSAEYVNEECSIGYAYYFMLNKIYNDPDIKVIKVDGVSPEPENMRNNTYPFITPLYAVIRSDELNISVYRQIYNYLVTEEGQEVVKMAGYCPVKE